MDYDKARPLAAKLLKSHLNAVQIQDWDMNTAFNVRGSDGRLYRVDCTHPQSHLSVVQEGGVGTAVWPVELDIPEDIALGMLLYLLDDAENVVAIGCHGYQYGNSPLRLGGDYNGLI